MVRIRRVDFRPPPGPGFNTYPAPPVVPQTLQTHPSPTFETKVLASGPFSPAFQWRVGPVCFELGFLGVKSTTTAGSPNNPLPSQGIRNFKNKTSQETNEEYSNKEQQTKNYKYTKCNNTMLNQKSSSKQTRNWETKNNEAKQTIKTNYQSS